MRFSPQSRLVARVMRWPTTALGAATDLWCVRLTGHSIINWLVSVLTGLPYFKPLLLTTTGARTGKLRRVVLPFFPLRDSELAVVGSNGGAPRDPHWIRNLRAQPEALIHQDRKGSPVRARFLESEERAKLWDEIAQHTQVYTDYQRRAEGLRDIPLVVLSRRATQGDTLDAGRAEYAK